MPKSKNKRKKGKHKGKKVSPNHNDWRVNQSNNERRQGRIAAIVPQAIQSMNDNTAL